MTVAELIEKLREMPPDVEVFTVCWEFTDYRSIKEVVLKKGKEYDDVLHPNESSPPCVVIDRGFD